MIKMYIKPGLFNLDLKLLRKRPKTNNNHKFILYQLKNKLIHQLK